MNPKQKRLGELLIDAGLINQDQLRVALDRQKSWGDRLGANLIATGALTEEELLLFLAKKTGIKEIDLDSCEIPSDIVSMIPYRVAQQFNVIPVRLEGKNTLVVACADPTDLNALDQLAFITGQKIVPMVSSYSAVVRAINRYMLGYSHDPGRSTPVSGSRKTKDSEPEDVDATMDPDLIIYGDHPMQVMEVEKAVREPRQPSESKPAPLSRPEPQPEPEVRPIEEKPEISLDEELGFDFGRPLLNYAPAETEKPASGPDLNTNQFSFEQKMRALFQILVRKGIVTEKEIDSELMRLWSLDQLK